MRARLPRATLVTVTDQSTERSGREPSTSLSGEVRAQGQRARRFVGWIGLLSALERAIRSLSAPEGKGRSEGSDSEFVVDVELKSATTKTRTDSTPKRGRPR